MPARARRGSAAAAGEGGGTGGHRAATQLMDAAEERVEELERSLSRNQKAEAHLSPAPDVEGEEASVWYFAYGSNINRKVFEGRRRIRPAESVPAVLPGWKLTFTQPGLPYADPAFAAVEPAAAAADATLPDVNGVAHRITPSQWQYVLETEGAAGQSEDHGYLVVTARARTYGGQELEVQTLSVPDKIKARLQGRDALPSLRYLTLIREGAEEFGLASEYRGWLAGLQHYQAATLRQRLGKLIFSGVAFGFIFPVWTGMALWRRVTGMKAASNDRASRLMGRYTATVFAAVHGLHEVVRPVLGCGVSRE